MPVSVGYTTNRIVVNSGEVFEQGGAVHQWASGVSRDMERRAIALAPPARSHARWGTWATGKLAAAMYREIYESGPGRFVNFEVGNRSPHAKYVHDGTAYQGTRYIYTNLGWANKQLVDSWVKSKFFEGTSDDAGMWMPVTRVPGITLYFLRVHGQRANPFLQDAYAVTRQFHSGLPKIR